MQARFGMPGYPGVGKTQEDVGASLFLDEDALAKVLRRRVPGRLFWVDMSDLFGEWVPEDWIDQCLAVMALTPKLTHQILTKRPKRMADYLTTERGHAVWALAEEVARKAGMADALDSPDFAQHVDCWPLPNVWAGTSVENDDCRWRIDHRIGSPRIPPARTSRLLGFAWPA